MIERARSQCGVDLGDLARDTRVIMQVRRLDRRNLPIGLPIPIDPMLWVEAQQIQQQSRTCARQAQNEDRPSDRRLEHCGMLESPVLDRESRYQGIDNPALRHSPASIRNRIAGVKILQKPVETFAIAFAASRQPASRRGTVNECLCVHVVPPRTAPG